MIGQPRIRVFLTDAEADVALLPSHAHDNDAGHDLKCKWVEGWTPGNNEWTLYPGRIMRIHTGIGFDIPPGWFGKIFDRSSMAMQGVVSIGGVIDSGYNGEVMVALINHSEFPVRIERNQRVAQIVFMPCAINMLTRMSRFDLPQTERGANGFGSTNKS